MIHDMMMDVWDLEHFEWEGLGRTEIFEILGGFPHPKLHLSYQLVLR
jgi:hypothetical protein